MWRKQLRLNKTKALTTKTVPWISTDLKNQIEPPSIPLIKVDLEEQIATNITKVDIWRNPSQDTSETYKFIMSIFDNNQTEQPE